MIKLFAKALLNDPNKIKISRAPFDWLGHGMYFWENNYRRAVEWANEKFNKGLIAKPAVIGAVLDLGYCCDLLNAEHIQMLQRSFRDMDALYAKSGKALPRNTNIPGDKHQDRVLRTLDCAVIEFMHEGIARKIEEDIFKQGFTTRKLPDSVRGVFLEGGPVFDGSEIYDKTHIQINIRNPNCIKGFFLPRREKHPERSYTDVMDTNDERYFVSDLTLPYGNDIREVPERSGT